MTRQIFNLYLSNSSASKLSFPFFLFSFILSALLFRVCVRLMGHPHTVWQRPRTLILTSDTIAFSITSKGPGASTENVSVFLLFQRRFIGFCENHAHLSVFIEVMFLFLSNLIGREWRFRYSNGRYGTCLTVWENKRTV